MVLLPVPPVELPLVLPLLAPEPAEGLIPWLVSLLFLCFLLL